MTGLGATDATAAPHSRLRRRGPSPLPARTTGAHLVLLPTLNERAGLDATLTELEHVYHDPKERPTILVLDAHSDDGTSDVARRHGAHLRLQQGHGKGGAVREGLTWANEQGFSRVAILDADGTYPCDRLPALFGLLDHGEDLVVGVRHPTRPAGVTPRDLIHRLGNVILNTTAATLSGSPLLDVCSGFWGVRTERVADLGLTSDGFEIESEVFVKACRQKLRVTQLPIEYRERIGAAKLHAARDGARILLSILRHSGAPTATGAPRDGPPDRPAELGAVLLTLGTSQVVVRSPDPLTAEVLRATQQLQALGATVGVQQFQAVGVGPVDPLSPERTAEEPSGGPLDFATVLLSRSSPEQGDLLLENPPGTVRLSLALRGAIGSSAVGPSTMASGPSGAPGPFAILASSLSASPVRKLETLVNSNLTLYSARVLPREGEGRSRPTEWLRNGWHRWTIPTSRQSGQRG